MSTIVQSYFDRMAVTSGTITSAASQITFTSFRATLIRCQCATTWQYSNASAGTYFDVAANAVIEIPLLDAFSKTWFKHASSATLLVAVFGYGAI
jgi:hypothetical protein